MESSQPETERAPRSSSLAANLLIAAVALLVVALFATQYRNTRLRQASEWVARTHDVIAAAHSLLSSLDTAELFQRQLLTKQPFDDQAAYRSAVQRVHAVADSLRKSVADSDRQSVLLREKIDPFTRAQLQVWESQLRQPLPPSDDFSAVDSKRSPLLDSIHVHVNSFIKNEQAELISRDRQLESEYYFTNVFRSVYLLLIIAICITAYVTIRRQQRENSRLVASLAQTNAALEFRVEKRTAELQNANEELISSVEVIRKLNESLDQHNERLGESLKEIKSLYDFAPCGYHTVDKHGIIVRINRTELDWTGYTEGEVIGKMKASDMLTEASARKRDLMIEQLKQEGHLENLEFDIVRKDRSVFPVIMNTVAYFGSDGEYVENRSTMFDISDRKDLEKKVHEANEYLLRINEEKNKFIGMATHDLKNPVYGIAGLAQMMKVAGNLSADQLDSVNHIEASANKMKALIAKLLDLNRIEQEVNFVQKQTVSLKELLRRVMRTFENPAAEKGIELVLEAPSGVVEFRTDPSLIEQVIDNLMSNAIKFSAADRKVWLRAVKMGNYLVFEVEDQGPGIKETELPKLFGSFQRLSARPTGGESSTGLGLSIVKRIVDALGADIKVTSTEGKGTTFHVALKMQD